MSTFDSIIPSARDYISRALHGSVVIGDRLYIDGGELTYLKDDAPFTFLLDRTLSVDLSSDWTNDSVSFTSIDRSQTPHRNLPIIWPTLGGDAFYTAGGQVPFGLAWSKKAEPTPPELWKFTPDNSGGGRWAQEEGSTVLTGQARNAGPKASGNGLGYYLGGVLDFITYPQRDYGTLDPVTGLIEFNMTSGSWTSLSSAGISANGTVEFGGAHFVPTFGVDGILVVFGAIPPVTSLYVNATDAPPMSTISVFDPHTRAWYNQTAPGPSVPEWRKDFCIAGVAGDNGTYEIYMHGGTGWAYWNSLNSSYAASGIDSELAKDAIHVLSLPSFSWHQIEYEPIASRSTHTCHITSPASSQMLFVGGINYEQRQVAGRNKDRDVFAQGLGVFDLNELRWSSSWNSKAAGYRTPTVVKDYINANGATPSWESNELQSVVATVRTPEPTSSASPAPKSSSSASTGAIAGGVVGGIVGVAILAGLAWYFYLRRRRGRRNQQSRTDEHKSYEFQQAPSPAPRYSDGGKGEHSGSGVQEMYTENHRRELPAEGRPLIWEMDAPDHRSELPGR